MFYLTKDEWLERLCESVEDELMDEFPNGEIYCCDGEWFSASDIKWFREEGDEDWIDDARLVDWKDAVYERANRLKEFYKSGAIYI